MKYQEATVTSWRVCCVDDVPHFRVFGGGGGGLG